MQLFVETLVLAVLGSAAGLLLARLGVALIVRMNPLAIPRLTESSIDGRVLAVVLGAGAFIVVLAGFAPALALWRTNPHDWLKGGGQCAPRRGGSRTRTGTWWPPKSHWRSSFSPEPGSC